jgi:hypothetical protein
MCVFSYKTPFSCRELPPKSEIPEVDCTQFGNPFLSGHFPNFPDRHFREMAFKWRSPEPGDTETLKIPEYLSLPEAADKFILIIIQYTRIIIRK